MSPHVCSALITALLLILCLATIVGSILAFVAIYRKNQ